MNLYNYCFNVHNITGLFFSHVFKMAIFSTGENISIYTHFRITEINPVMDDNEMDT